MANYRKIAVDKKEYDRSCCTSIDCPSAAVMSPIVKLVIVSVKTVAGSLCSCVVKGMGIVIILAKAESIGTARRTKGWEKSKDHGNDLEVVLALLLLRFS